MSLTTIGNYKAAIGDAPSKLADVRTQFAGTSVETGLKNLEGKITFEAYGDPTLRGKLGEMGRDIELKHVLHGDGGLGEAGLKMSNAEKLKLARQQRHLGKLSADTEKEMEKFGRDYAKYLGERAKDLEKGATAATNDLKKAVNATTGLATFDATTHGTAQKVFEIGGKEVKIKFDAAATDAAIAEAGNVITISAASKEAAAKALAEQGGEQVTKYVRKGTEYLNGAKEALTGHLGDFKGHLADQMGELNGKLNALTGDLAKAAEGSAGKGVTHGAEEGLAKAGEKAGGKLMPAIGTGAGALLLVSGLSEDDKMNWKTAAGAVIGGVSAYKLLNRMQQAAGHAHVPAI